MIQVSENSKFFDRGLPEGGAICAHLGSILIPVKVA
jgi:hypothetical protein